MVGVRRRSAFNLLNSESVHKYIWLKEDDLSRIVTEGSFRVGSKERRTTYCM